MPDQQQQINYGAAPNDGQGDPLRDAFIKTDDNFDAIWNAGPVGSNITILNNTVGVVNTNGNLVLRPNGVGVIQANASIVPDSANIRDLGTADRRWRRAYIQTLNTVDYEVDGNLTVSGNLTIQGDTIQVGNLITDARTLQLANTAANATQANGSGITVGAADNIATILYDNSANVWQINIGVTTPGNVTAAYFSGDGSELTGMYGNANVGDYLVTYTGNISGDNIDINGNIVANYFLGDGSQLTGLPEQYSNANVVSLLADFGSNNIVTTGNVQAERLQIQNGVGNAWTIYQDSIFAPSGGEWRSENDSLDDYITSAANGYINLQSLYDDGNIASELKLEHGVARLIVADAPFNEWNFASNGNLTTPGGILPEANAVYSLGSESLQWADLWVANNTIYIGGVPLGVTGNTLTVNGEAVLSNDSSSNIATTGDLTAGNIAVTGTANINGEVYGQYFSLRGGNPTGTIGAVGYGGNVVELVGYEGVKIVAGSDEVSPYWEFDTAGDLTAPGNVSANAILTDNYFYANGAPFSSGANIGNLEVTGTTIGIAAGASESTITVGSATSGLTVNPDSEVPVAKMYAYSTAQDFFSQGGDYTSGTYTAGGVGGVITLTGATIVEDYLNASQYTIVSVTINGTDTVPYDSGGWGGGTVTINTTTPPAVDPTTVTDIEFNTQFENRLVMDTDEGDYGIYIGDHNFDIESVRDVRITAGDDFSIESNDGFSLRSVANATDTDGIYLITDYNGSGKEWFFSYTGNLTAPGDITVAGDITGTSGASTLVLKAQPDSNTAIQLNNIVDSTISTVANLEISTDVAGTAKTWRFDTDGNLVFPDDSIQTTAYTGLGNLDISGTMIEFAAGATEELITISPDGFAGQAVLQLPNNATANVYDTILTNSGGNVKISSGDGVAVYDWLFGTDGVLTAPGNISATNFIISESLIGADASPAPTISGFSTISATGNVTGGNLTTSGQVVATGNITGGNMRATSYRNASGDSILGDFVFANNTLQTDNGDGGITLSIFGPDQADPPALIEKAWLFGNTGAFYSPGNVEAPKFVGNGLFNGTTSIEIPTANSNIYVGFGNVGSIEFNAEGVNALNLAATGNVTGATANISGNISATRLQNDANLEIRSNVAGTLRNWTFDTLGDLNLPAGGNIVGSGGISANNITLTGNISANTAGFAIGYRDIPQVSFTGNATIATTDAGKHFYSTESTDYILTIANNASQGFAVGAAISIVNQGTGNITIAQGSGVTLYLAGNATSGNRTLSTFGMATIMKVATDTWFINGTGVA